MSVVQSIKSIFNKSSVTTTPHLPKMHRPLRKWEQRLTPRELTLLATLEEVDVIVTAGIDKEIRRREAAAQPAPA